MPVPLFFLQELRTRRLPSEALAEDLAAPADPGYAPQFAHALAVIGTWARNPKPEWRQKWAAQELRAVYSYLSKGRRTHRSVGPSLNKLLPGVSDRIKAIVSQLPSGSPLLAQTYYRDDNYLIVLMTSVSDLPGRDWEQLRDFFWVLHEGEKPDFLFAPREGATPVFSSVTHLGERLEIPVDQPLVVPLLSGSLILYSGEGPKARPEFAETSRENHAGWFSPVRGRSAAEVLSFVFGFQQHNMEVRVSRGRIDPVRKDRRR